MNKLQPKPYALIIIGIALCFVIALITLSFTTYAPFNIRAASAGVKNTKHDLSITGPGPIKADASKTGVSQVCVFCHTPHGANLQWSTTASKLPLWNRNLSTATYTVLGPPGASNTRITTPGQPDMGSKLCLGCHDGTIAIGLLLNPPIESGLNYPQVVPMTGTGPGGVMPTNAAGYLGTDISAKHMVSIEYDTGLSAAMNAQCIINGKATDFAVYDPNEPPVSNDTAVKLRPTTHNNGKIPDTPGTSTARLGVQCRTCHDPHDNSYGKFMVKGTPLNNYSDVCIVCHYTCTP